MSPLLLPVYSTLFPRSKSALKPWPQIGSVPKQLSPIIIFPSLNSSNYCWVLLSWWWTFWFFTYTFPTLVSLTKYWITSLLQHFFLHVYIVFPSMSPFFFWTILWPIHQFFTHFSFPIFPVKFELNLLLFLHLGSWALPKRNLLLQRLVQLYIHSFKCSWALQYLLLNLIVVLGHVPLSSLSATIPYLHYC